MFSKSPPALCPRVLADQIPAVAPSTRHPPSVARMPTCAPATMSHHITSLCVVASHHRCPLLCCRPSLLQPVCRAMSSKTMLHAAPLLPPSLLTPRATHLASSSLAPCRVGTRRAAWPCPAPPPGLLTRANGVRTNALHDASTQGRCHCDVTVAPCCVCVCSCRSAAAPSHHL
jgi:hypothetical protein